MEDLTNTEEGQYTPKNKTRQPPRSFARRPKGEVHAATDQVNMPRTPFQEGPSRCQDKQRPTRSVVQPMQFQEHMNQSSTDELRVYNQANDFHTPGSTNMLGSRVQ
ncbi:hypothetical protein Tco_0555414 [Tanacetum coccineum]